MARKKRDEQRAPFGEPEFIENPEADPVKASQRKQQTLRRWFMIAAIAALTMIPLNLVLLGTSLSNMGQQGNAGPVGEQNSSPGKSLAMQAMLSWLSQDPVPLEGGRLLSWDGVEVKPPPPIPDNAAAGTTSGYPRYDVEIHKFTIADIDGYLYHGSIAIETNEAMGARVQSTPTLMPIAPSLTTGEDWGASVPWFGWDQSQAPEPVRAAVQSWAVAFTSGDPVKLRQQVGDTDPEHAYMPLGIANDTKTEIVVSAIRVPEEGDDPNPSVMLARVALTASLNGQVVEQGASTRAPITFDVLIHGADTASPRIVSWGAAGAGASLTEYSVAITGREPGAMEPKPSQAAPSTPAPTTPPTAEPQPAPPASPEPPAEPIPSESAEPAPTGTP